MSTATKAEHTPGPWNWYGDKGLEAKNETVLVGDCGTASCGRTKLFVSEADARLIAAAPEMLEALEQAVLGLKYPHKIPDMRGLVNAVDAATQKAKGGR